MGKVHTDILRVSLTSRVPSKYTATKAAKRRGTLQSLVIGTSRWLRASVSDQISAPLRSHVWHGILGGGWDPVLGSSLRRYLNLLPRLRLACSSALRHRAGWSLTQLITSTQPSWSGEKPLPSPVSPGQHAACLES